MGSKQLEPAGICGFRAFGAQAHGRNGSAGKFPTGPSLIVGTAAELRFPRSRRHVDETVHR